MITLRDYQIEARNQILDWVYNQNPRIVPTVVSVMGSGKTILACAAIKELLNSGKKVWVVVNRSELVDQWIDELNKVCGDTLQSHNRDIGIIEGSSPKTYHRRIQIVMVQTLTRRFKTIADRYKPDVMLCDEAHEVAFQKIISIVRDRWPSVKQINLTATPVRHGKSNVQYEDLYPKEHWLVVKTASQMILSGLWKRPIWRSASTELSELTVQRFSGIKISGGDYDDTSQASVMIDLLPHHLAEWQQQGGNQHHCVFFCVNVEHSNKTAEALTALGRKVAVITGETPKSERKRAIEAFKSGQIDDLINCQCLTTGFDAPIASCAVWLRRTLSVGLFNQMAGRVLRKFDGVTDALMLDLAGNLALHPFPELIDWEEFDPCQKVFRDPRLVICQNCGYRHDSIPTPIHPSDAKIPWISSAGLFKDGLQIPYTTTIRCHHCSEPVYFDRQILTEYGGWLKETVRSKLGNKRIKGFPHETAGILIGKSEPGLDPLNINTLYDLGIWKITESSGDGGDTRDKGEEYRELLTKQARNLQSKELSDLRMGLLTPRQQEFIVGITWGKLKKLSYRDAYRAAIAVAYVKNYSPLWAFQFWDRNREKSVSEQEIEKAFTNICQGNPTTYQLLHQWLELKFEELEQHDYAKKGMIKKLKTILENLATT